MDAPRSDPQRPDPQRSDTLRSIADAVHRIGMLSDRIGHLFADHQNLHPTDFRALTAIHEAERAGRPLTAKDLAAQLQLSPAAITYLVERLVASGHVRRDRDDSDRRRVILRFDEPGRTVASAFFGPLGAAHADALASISDADLTAAHRVLDSVVIAMAEFEGRMRDGQKPPAD